MTNLPAQFAGLLNSIKELAEATRAITVELRDVKERLAALEARVPAEAPEGKP